jgi:hypothetical protein
MAFREKLPDGTTKITGGSGGGSGLPSGGAAGETLAKLSATDGDAGWIPTSVPVVWLPAGSDETDVPVGTPDKSLIIILA